MPDPPPAFYSRLAGNQFAVTQFVIVVIIYKAVLVLFSIQVISNDAGSTFTVTLPTDH